MKDRNRMIVAALLTLPLILACVGCGSRGGPEAPTGRLLEDYIDPAGPGGSITLLLYEGGGFQVRQCPRDACDSDAPSGFVAAGEWERSEGILVLSTDDWEAMLVAAIVPVSLNDRADTLRGLQWMQSSSETPVDSCRFIPREAFTNFVHPVEGSGTSSW